MSVINFKILNYTGRYDEASNAYIFDFSLEWGDRIDSNLNYGGDSKAEAFFKKINPNATDYNITIRWKQQVIWKPSSTPGEPASKKHNNTTRGNPWRPID